MDFSEKVKFVRGKLLLSQIALAKKIGISNVTINRWEVKKIKPSFLAEKKFYTFCEKNGIKFEDNKK